MTDLIKSIKANMYDKTTSPLAGAFVFSWITWNHRFLMMLFSDYSVEEKFDLLNGLLYWHSTDLNPIIHKLSLIWSYGLAWLIFPLIMSGLIIWLYPLPAKWAFEHAKKEQQKLTKIKQGIEDNTLLTQEQSNNIRLDITKAKDEFHKSIVEKDESIDSLKKQKQNMSEQITDKMAEIIVSKKSNQELLDNNISFENELKRYENNKDMMDIKFKGLEDEIKELHGLLIKHDINFDFNSKSEKFGEISMKILGRLAATPGGKSLVQDVSRTLDIPELILYEVLSNLEKRDFLISAKNNKGHFTSRSVITLTDKGNRYFKSH